MFVVGHVAADPRAGARRRPEVLRLAVGVAGDDRVRRGQDRLGRAVVLLQQDRARVRVVPLELQDVADGGAPERVNRLVGVADDAQFRGRDRLRGRGGAGWTGADHVSVDRVPIGAAGQLPHQHVLRMVRVLVLVHEHVPEPAPVVLGRARERLQQVDRRHNQIVEVERVRLAQPALVEPVRLGQHLVQPGGRLRRPGLVVDQFVLEVAHPRCQRPRRVPLRVQIQVPAHQRHEAVRVGLVVDRKRRFQAERLRLGAQDPDAHRVERAHPHHPRPRPDQRGHPVPHLAGRLVGERDGEDLTGLDVPMSEQVGDPVGQHPGLARAGPGHDQHWRSGVLDRGPLLRVEPVQQRRRIHGQPDRPALALLAPVGSRRCRPGPRVGAPRPRPGRPRHRRHEPGAPRQPVPDPWRTGVVWTCSSPANCTGQHRRCYASRRAVPDDVPVFLRMPESGVRRRRLRVRPPDALGSPARGVFCCPGAGGSGGTDRGDWP